MKHYLKLIFVAIATIVILINSATSNTSNTNSQKITLEDKKSSNENFNYQKFLSDIINNIESKYIENKTRKELFEAAASGILNSLDPHSGYLNEDSFKEIKIKTKGEFGGLGIEITTERQLTKVISPIDDTPAFKAGIKAGDYISRVNGESIFGKSITDVVKLLRGKPQTKVTITVLRKGAVKPLEFTIMRDIIQIKPIKSDIYGNVIYIKLNTFSSKSALNIVKTIRESIKKIGHNKIDGLILDLRNNPGGLLEESVEVSKIFLDKDQEIVSIKGRNDANTKIYKDDQNETLTKNIPMIVLINEGSASASEIVAGALQDHRRAVIMGKKSFGKGSVQSIIPINDKKSAIKMTIALYYTPSGVSIQADGIKPDIIVSDAKIEKLNSQKYTSEADLDGHLEKHIADAKEEKKDQVKDENLEIYDKDYQLARAIDLVRGISFYDKIKAKGL